MKEKIKNNEQGILNIEVRANEIKLQLKEAVGGDANSSGGFMSCILFIECFLKQIFNTQHSIINVQVTIRLPLLRHTSAL